MESVAPLKYTAELSHWDRGDMALEAENAIWLLWKKFSDYNCSVF